MIPRAARPAKAPGSTTSGAWPDEKAPTILPKSACPPDSLASIAGCERLKRLVASCDAFSHGSSDRTVHQISARGAGVGVATAVGVGGSGEGVEATVGVAPSAVGGTAVSIGAAAAVGAVVGELAGTVGRIWQAAT